MGDLLETRPRPPGHVPACAYGCCWKLPGQTWAEAKKKWQPPTRDQSVSASPPERRASLSGEREAPRRRQWLSR